MARFVVFALILPQILPMSATAHPNLLLFPKAAGCIAHDPAFRCLPGL
jgi:hypothetical protein